MLCYFGAVYATLIQHNFKKKKKKKNITINFILNRDAKRGELIPIEIRDRGNVSLKCKVASKEREELDMQVKRHEEQEWQERVFTRKQTEQVEADRERQIKEQK